MYNGIGLQTARGSGTNGYVQRNLAVIYKPKNKDEFKNTSDLSAPSLRKANNEILEHDKKRGLELKCLEYQQALEEQKLSEDEIEDKVSAYRTTLLNDYDSNLKQKCRTIAKDTHEIAEAQIRKNEKARSAFGISESFVDGSSFDRERKAREAAEKEIREKQYSILHSSSENENEPQTEEIEKQTKKSSSPSDKSSKKKHKKKHKRKHSSSDEKENDKSRAHKDKHRRHSYEGESEDTSHSKKNTFNEGESRTSYRGECDTSQDKMRGREMRRNRRSEEKNEERKHRKSKSIERKKKKYESDSRERRHHRSVSAENSFMSKSRAIDEKRKNGDDNDRSSKYTSKLRSSIDYDDSGDEHIDSRSGSTQKTSVDKTNKKYKYGDTIKNSKSHDHRRRRDSSPRDDSDEPPKEKKSNRRDEHRDSSYHSPSRRYRSGKIDDKKSNHHRHRSMSGSSEPREKNKRRDRSESRSTRRHDERNEGSHNRNYTYKPTKRRHSRESIESTDDIDRHYRDNRDGERLRKRYSSRDRLSSLSASKNNRKRKVSDSDDNRSTKKKRSKRSSSGDIDNDRRKKSTNKYSPQQSPSPFRKHQNDNGRNSKTIDNVTNSKEQQRARIEELGDIQTDEMDLLPLPQSNSLSRYYNSNDRRSRSINSVSKIELPKENNSGESANRKIARDDSFDDDNLFSDKVVKKEHIDKNIEEEMRQRIVKRREEMMVNTVDEEPKMKRTTATPVNFGITEKQNTFNEIEKTVTDDIPIQTEKIDELIAQALAKTQTALKADRTRTLMSLKRFLANVKSEKSSSESSGGNESDSVSSASSTTSQTTSDSDDSSEASSTSSSSSSSSDSESSSSESSTDTDSDHRTKSRSNTSSGEKKRQSNNHKRSRSKRKESSEMKVKGRNNNSDGESDENKKSYRSRTINDKYRDKSTSPDTTSRKGKSNSHKRSKLRHSGNSSTDSHSSS